MARGGPKGHPAYNVNGEGGAPVTVWTDEAIDALADRLDAFRKKDHAIYFKQFFEEEDIHTQQFHRLLEKSKRLRDAYERVKNWQERKFLEGGLTGTFKEQMTKFALWNVCKWTECEKQQSKNEASGLSVEDLLKLVATLKAQNQ